MKKLIFLVLLFSIEITLAKPVTLKECRELALTRNERIKAEQALKKSAAHLKRAAYTNFLPRLDFGASYLRVNKKFSLSTEKLGDPLGNDYTAIPLYDISAGRPRVIAGEKLLLPKEIEFGKKNIAFLDFSITQPLFTGGKLTKLASLASKTESIADDKTRLEKEKIYLETEKTYWNLVSFMEKKKSALKYLDLMKTLEKDVSNYYEEGLTVKNESLKVRVKLDAARLNLLKVEDAIQLISMDLNRLMGLPLETELTPIDSIEINGDGITEKSPEKALSRRLELKSLRKLISVSQDGIRIEQSRYLPNIFLQAHYYQSDPNPYNGFSHELGGDWMVGVFCQFELFHFGNRHFKISAAKSQKNALEHELKETENKVRLEITQKAFKFKQGKTKLDLALHQKEQAEENLKVTDDYFKEGMVKTGDLLEAQTLWLKAANKWTEARTEYRLSLLEYKKALGILILEGE